MDISAVQAKLLLSQIGGTKELIKANVAQNTKAIQKDPKIDKNSQYIKTDINDKAEISEEATKRYNNWMEKTVNDPMEYKHSDALMFKKACRAYRKAC